MSAVPASKLSQHRMLTGKSWRMAARVPVEAGVVRPALGLLRQHNADSDRARRFLPVGDDIGHRRIVRVNRLEDFSAKRATQ